MSKEVEARVRNELLQELYTRMLRCTLAARTGSRARSGEAIAAGVTVNLQARDLLLLPPGGGSAFRLLRGLGPGAQGRSGAERLRALRAGVTHWPGGGSETEAVHFALGAAAAASHAEEDSLVCVVLPLSRAGLPAGWAAALDEAAALALPLLLVSDGPLPSALDGDALARQPAPRCPAIPVDREDALAIYRVAFECAARARTGGGPSLLQCTPFRLRRSRAGELPEATALEHVERMLRERGAFGKRWQQGLERQLLRELSGS